MASESVAAEHSAWNMPNWLRGLLVVALVIGALALLVVGWNHTGSPLAVEVDGHRHTVRSHAMTVGAALHDAGFDLHPEDLVSPGLETPLRDHAVVRVQRARPVTLSADGQIHQYRTHALTVAGFLAEVGVQTGPADEIWLDARLVEPSTPLGSGANSAHQGKQGGGSRSAVEEEATEPPLITLRRAVSLILDDGGVTTTLHTTSATVGKVLQEHDVLLFLGDEVTPALQDRIVPGMTVEIQRSVPVEIRVDDRLIRTRTRAGIVAGALGQEGIALIGKDRVEPDLSAPIQPDMTIRVTRVREEFVVEFEAIPFEMVWVPDPEVEIDNIRLAQDGQIGLTKRRYRVVYENNQQVDHFLEDVWAEQPPITKTMAYGTKIVIRTMDTPEGPIEYWRKMRVYTTSYRPASAGRPKEHPRYGRTRLGWVVRKGIVAVDPDVIPLKTYMYVPGYGLARAGDTGGGVKGKFVDLGYRDNEYQSWHWWSDIYLLTPVPPRDEIRWVLPDWPRYPDRRR